MRPLHQTQHTRLSTGLSAGLFALWPTSAHQPGSRQCVLRQQMRIAVPIAVSSLADCAGRQGAVHQQTTPSRARRHRAVTSGSLPASSRRASLPRCAYVSTGRRPASGFPQPRIPLAQSGRTGSLTRLSASPSFWTRLSPRPGSRTARSRPSLCLSGSAAMVPSCQRTGSVLPWRTALWPW